MRLLITIPHYYAPSPEGRYGSEREDRQTRSEAVGRCIRAIHLLFGDDQYTTSLIRPGNWLANQATTAQVDVMVCTVKEHDHLLEELRNSGVVFKHCVCDSEPRMLGFQCHRLLQQNLGRYDFYCYMEDDLILHDPWFFAKLRWFNAQAGNCCVLQPNRYEVTNCSSPKKCYIDGVLHEQATAQYQTIQDRPQVLLTAMETAVSCRRTLNPHSGCFFLSGEQMEYWARRPYFLDGDTSFFSPLESAATLGLMRTFRVYKPSPRYANFLEVEHAGDAWITRLDERPQRQQASAAEISSDA